MLLLSGVHDEVVPREHMKGLWELVQQRVPGGRRAAPPAYFAPLEEDKPKDERVRSPGNGYSQFKEFEKGTHSASLRHSCFSFVMRISGG